MEIVKRAPPKGLASHHTLPRSALSTTRLAKAKPKPLPAGRLLKPSSKILPRSSGATPVPPSSTRTKEELESCPHSTSIGRGASAACTAFRSRFATAKVRRCCGARRRTGELGTLETMRSLPSTCARASATTSARSHRPGGSLMVSAVATHCSTKSSKRATPLREASTRGFSADVTVADRATR